MTSEITFDRYTDRARRAVVLADQAAARMLHGTVDTGHLLLGLIGEGGGVAFRALDSLGVTAQAAAGAVRQRRPAGDTHPTAHRPFTPQLKKAYLEARRLRRGPAAPREQLHRDGAPAALGLIREKVRYAGALALADCGAPDPEFPATVRARVHEILRGYADTEREARAEAAKPVLTLEDGSTIARLFASWAQREGILARVTEEQFKDLANAFMYGYACGAGNAAGERAAAGLRAKPGEPGG